MKIIARPFAGFLSAVAGSLLVVAVFHFTLWGKDAPPNIKVSTTPLVRDVKLGTSFAPVVKKAAPSVVNIYSTRTIREQPMRNPFHDNPMFRQFFGDQFPGDGQPRSRKEQGLGSGVIISPDGYILTANHVVNGADEIKVGIADDTKKEYTAKVIGTDPQTDVAVLKIDATGLPAVTLADSDQLEIGDVVLAIGNPFGVGQTVTMGIVSGLGRHGYGINGVNGYENFIQTDAAINPGNSGGALIDAEGRLVGINTWIASRSGGNEGVGFAVPINMARRSVERLISGGSVMRGYLGITMQDVDANLAKQFSLPDENGALVNDVMPGTPAEKAGIKSGDVIVAFNGKPIADSHSLQLTVSEKSPGSSATLKLIRNGVPKTISITLGELPKQFGGNPGQQNDSQTDTSKTDALDGVTVADLDRDARQELKIPTYVQGALVDEVDADSNAAGAGLQKDDVIVEINRQPVNDADSAVKLCEQAKGDQILLKIWRRSGERGGTHYLSVDNTRKK
ncbi:MAG: DegQ family serine endoprotease [Verrucomicrobiales bacterium]|nr:DegQ family serine endoprotease [Verrucomicrobiales bacterium]